MVIDIAMSKDLARRRKNTGYAAICAVGYASDAGVFRLATAENIEGHLSLLQPGTWEPLYFLRSTWTPGLAVARTVVVGAERELEAAGKSLGQHWYRAELAMLDHLLEAELAKLRAPSWSHSELIARLRRQSNQEADRFADGIF